MQVPNSLAFEILNEEDVEKMKSFEADLRKNYDMVQAEFYEDKGNSVLLAVYKLGDQRIGALQLTADTAYLPYK